MGILSNEVGSAGVWECIGVGVHPKLKMLEFWMGEQQRGVEALEKLAGLLEKAMRMEGDKEKDAGDRKETEERVGGAGA